MARKKITKAVEPEVVAPAKGELSVYSARGQFVRTFSSELHGPDFAQLAKGYAGKIKGSVR